MPAFFDLDLIVNAANPRLSGLLTIAQNGQVIRGNPKLPDVVRGDQLQCRFRLVEPSGTGYRQFDDIDLSMAVVTAAIGARDIAPTGGTFYLKVGSILSAGPLVVGKRYLIAGFQAGDNFANVGAAANAAGVTFVATGAFPTDWTHGSSIIEITADLDSDINDTDLQAALNTTAAITLAGGVSVMLYSTADFMVAFNAFGEQPQITGDGSKLLPLAFVSTARSQQGSAAAVEIQTVRLIQQPYCFAVWSSAFPPAGYTVDQLQDGDVTHPSIQRLKLAPQPYDGTFTFVLEGTSYTARFNLGETDMQMLVGATVVVTKTGENQWDFQWVANGVQAAITANVAGLYVPKGVTGTIYLNTVGLEQAFASGANSLALILEVKIQFPSAGPETKLQLPITVNRAVINTGALAAAAMALVGVTYAPNLTALRGSASALDHIVTAGPAGIATGSLIIAIINGVASLWQLQAGAGDPTDLNGQVDPTDYDAVTNDRHWAEVL